MNKTPFLIFIGVMALLNVPFMFFGTPPFNILNWIAFFSISFVWLKIALD